MMLLRLCLGALFIIAGSLSTLATPLVSAESDDGQYRAMLTVSPDQPFLADMITFTLTVTCPDDVDVQFPPFGNRLGDLDVIDIRKTNRELVLMAIPQRAGKTPIWTITIQCGEQQIDLPAFELEIAAEIDSKNVSLDNIGLSAEPIPKPSWHFYAVVMLLVLTALILLWLLYRRKNAELPAEIPPLTAQEIALRRLADLLESRKHESDVKGFFIELSDIVRWYVERLTGIQAPELTTEEFLHKIASNEGIQPAHRYWQANEQPNRYAGSLKTMVPFLESADIVKFAKHVPANEEIMLAFRRAKNFVSHAIYPDSNHLPDSGTCS